MWNEFVCQFRPVCYNDPTIILTRSPRKGSWQRVVATRWGRSPHLQSFHGYFKSSLPRMIGLPARGRNWPAHSPDLSPPDYFLLVYLKSLVYKDCSKTLEGLRNNIRAEMGNILVNMLEKGTQSFRN
ncbi:uncharacterized protein TNCV_3602061 [Trichonephila clavipes]|nr:uncharacterized protein TNCV_3602061 [Trichonephila clavipes]